MNILILHEGKLNDARTGKCSVQFCYKICSPLTIHIYTYLCRVTLIGISIKKNCNKYHIFVSNTIVFCLFSVESSVNIMPRKQVRPCDTRLPHLTIGKNFVISFDQWNALNFSVPSPHLTPESAVRPCEEGLWRYVPMMSIGADPNSRGGSTDIRDEPILPLLSSSSSSQRVRLLLRNTVRGADRVRRDARRAAVAGDDDRFFFFSSSLSLCSAPHFTRHRGSPHSRITTIHTARRATRSLTALTAVSRPRRYGYGAYALCITAYSHKVDVHSGDPARRPSVRFSFTRPPYRSFVRSFVPPSVRPSLRFCLLLSCRRASRFFGFALVRFSRIPAACTIRRIVIAHTRGTLRHMFRAEPSSTSSTRVHIRTHARTFSTRKNARVPEFHARVATQRPSSPGWRGEDCRACATASTLADALVPQIVEFLRACALARPPDHVTVSQPVHRGDRGGNRRMGGFLIKNCSPFYYFSFI